MIEKMFNRILKITERASLGECPEPEVLAGFRDNTLEGDELEIVETHLTSCTFCLEQVIIASQAEKLEKTVTPIRQKPDVVIRFFQKSVEVIKNIGEELVQLSAPDLLMGRNASQQDPVLVKFCRKFEEDLSCHFEIEKFSDKTCEIRMKMLQNESNADKVRITMSSKERELESRRTENGRVLFERIELGAYTYTFKKNGLIVGKITMVIQ